MKNYSIIRLFLILFVVAGLSANAVAQTDSTKAAKAKKYTGPVPCASVNSHNGSLIPVGTYVFINRYFNVGKDQLYSGTDEVGFTAPGARGFYYQELQTAFRTGIIKGVDVRLIMSLFQKRLDRNTPASDITDINSGLGDAKLIGRYGIFNQKTGPFNLIAGIGVTIPMGTTDAEDNSGNLLPSSMQLGSGSWNPLFEVGIHKIVKRHWTSGYFVYMLAMEGELGSDAFTRSDALKYNFAYAYAISQMFDIGAELNGELKSKAEVNGAALDNTGGHVLYFSPELHFKFAKLMHFDISFPIPVYQDLNGPQLGTSSMIVAKLAMKF